jgi:hypothetical protein
VSFTVKKTIEKVKLALRKTLHIGTKNFLIPSVDALVADKPEFLPCWILVKGFYGALFDIKQEEISDFVSFIRENKQFFTKEVLEDKSFQDGFVITFEEYIKQRKQEKRKIIQSIFLGFAEQSSKEDFELERMYDLLNKVSGFHIHLIGRIAKLRQVKIRSNERYAVEKDYDHLKYLEYLGILNCERKSYVETSVEPGEESADSEFYENETFTLSVFGEDFVSFLVE